MSEKLTTARLADIVPGDVPKRLNWIRVNNLYPNAECFQNNCLDNYGIRIMETRRKLLSPDEGDHRMALVTKHLGSLAIVSFTLGSYNDNQKIEQDNWIDIVRGLGIYSFLDFYHFCERGYFPAIDYS